MNTNRITLKSIANVAVATVALTVSACATSASNHQRTITRPQINPVIQEVALKSDSTNADTTFNSTAAVPPFQANGGLGNVFRHPRDIGGNEPSVNSDRAFKAFAVVSTGLAIADCVSTENALKSNPNAREANPVLHPVAGKGYAQTCAATLALNYLQLHLSNRARKNGSKIWWIMPTINVAARGYAAGMNFRVTY